MNPSTKIIDTIAAGLVARYHAAPSVEPQSVAHHSWNVAVLVHYLYPAAPKDLIIEALGHDVGEYWTGDAPFSIKRDHPEIKELYTDLEFKHRYYDSTMPTIELPSANAKLLKLCDTLDGFLWCSLHERGTRISDRWNESYNLARKKFWDDLDVIDPVLWDKADHLFSEHGGIIA